MTYDLNDLLTLMARLRDPVDGCPWDQKQTMQTIIPYTLEEVYEVVDAIESGDVDHTKEELGDLLFQVVFYAQIAHEKNEYQFSDIVDKLVKKLIFRHPHVFPTGELSSRAEDASSLDDQQLHKQWDALKAKEKTQSKEKSILDDVPLALPALQRAQKLQKKAAKQGFDWQTLLPVIENLEGEIEELKQAIKNNSEKEITDEMGDVLFSAVNVARHLSVNAEEALRFSNHKFSKRFKQVERLVDDTGVPMKEHSGEQLELFWQQAKKI